MCNQRGFSLIELVVTVSILVIVAGVVGPLLYMTVSMVGNPIARADMQESGSLALYRMGREIRRIAGERNPTLYAGTNSSQLEFTDTSGTRIRYRLVGNSLMRRTGTGTERILANNLQTGGLNFAYYDELGNTVTPDTGQQGTNVQRIRVQLTLQSGGQLGRASTQIILRNLYNENYDIP